jgi:hypothetical protein
MVNIFVQPKKMVIMQVYVKTFPEDAVFPADSPYYCDLYRSHATSGSGEHN